MSILRSVSVVALLTLVGCGGTDGSSGGSLDVGGGPSDGSVPGMDVASELAVDAVIDTAADAAVDGSPIGMDRATTPDGAMRDGATCMITPGQDPSTFPSCCTTGAAHCVAASVVPASVASTFTACGTGGLCVPDPIIRAGGSFAPAHCHSLGGVDGRCLSVCIGMVAAVISLLPMDTCAADERCAPCINPITMMPSGACDIMPATCPDGGAVDSGVRPDVRSDVVTPDVTPRDVSTLDVRATDAASDTALVCMRTPGQDPAAFPTCCMVGAAHCVPSRDVPASLVPSLAACGTGGVCLPDTIIRAGSDFAPTHCHSIGASDGRCLSTCLPMVGAQAAILPMDVCATGDRCVPCINPLDGTSTGACEIAPMTCDADGGTRDGGAIDGASGDTGPRDAPPADVRPVCPYTGPPLINPATLPTCCAAGGAHCVPSALVPPATASMLTPCAGGYCAPDPFIATGGNFIPATCNSVGGAEGRCLSACLPVVAAQAARLPQSTCTMSERCVPCSDPFTGMATGACALSCDPGPTRPPVRFASCCSGNATCVPTDLVPMASRASLVQRTCMTGSLCVPNENLDPAHVPVACTGRPLLGAAYSGFCVSNCANLPAIAALLFVRGTCGSNDTCAACTTFGIPTGVPGCM